MTDNFYLYDIKSVPGQNKIQVWQQGNFTNDIPDAVFSIVSYDVSLGNYYPDTARSGNFLEVLSCDTVKNEVEGRFQVFMKKYGIPSPYSFVPDTVFLSQGRFYLKLEE